LYEAERVERRGIPLAVDYSGPCACILHFTTLEEFLVSHVIFMDEFAIYTIRDDLHLFVRVFFEPRTRLNCEIIKGYQIPKTDILRVAILSKRKMEAASMPSIISQVYLTCLNLE